MTLPSQQTAVLAGPTAGTTALTTTHPLPTPTSSELLIRVHSAALNPSDWMVRDWPWLTVPGAVLGFDFSGTVITPSASGRFRAGDRVAGFVPGACVKPHRSGAFAEYLVAPSHTTLKIPDDVSFEEAASLGMGIATAGQGIYQTLSLPMEGERLGGKKVLVYGASTATGQYAVQLAKEAGAYVIATSGVANIDFVLELGADVAVDYKDEKAMEAVGDVELVMDCVSTPESAKFCIRRFGNDGGRYAAVLRLPDVAREGVVGPVFRLCYTVFGYDVMEFKGSEEEKEFGRKLFELAQKLLNGRKIRPLRVQVLEGGLGAVGNAITEIKEGKVRGKKWIVRIGDTPGILARESQ